MCVIFCGDSDGDDVSDISVEQFLNHETWHLLYVLLPRGLQYTDTQSKALCEEEKWKIWINVTILYVGYVQK